MYTNIKGSSSRRKSERLKSQKRPNTSINNPIHIEIDDDDFVNPPVGQQPLLTGGHTQTNEQEPPANESLGTAKRKLNLDDVGQGKKVKNERKKLKKATKKMESKFHLVDEELESNEEKQDGKAAKPKKATKARKPEKSNITEKFKLRNSPISLTNLVKYLSDQQKEWVRSSGFGLLLDFSLEKIPHRLACTALEAFDAETCSLKVHSESIHITNQDVYDVLGFPIGDRSLTMATEIEASKRHTLWRAQFTKENITTCTVIERIKESGEADELFKMNFLIVISNVLIERKTGSYVHRDILSFDIQHDECNQYNWCEFLLACLVRTKSTWRKTTASLFYTGPIIFLTIFYVDRVIFKDLEPVKRQLPKFKGWTLQLLKQRQNYEKNFAASVEGLIIRQREEQVQVDEQGVEEGYAQQSPVVGDGGAVGDSGQKNMWQNADQVEENDVEHSQRVRDKKQRDAGQSANQVEVNNVQHSQPVREKEQGDKGQHWFERLSLTATMLMDAMEQYNVEMQSAKDEHPNDNNIADLEVKVVDIVKTLNLNIESNIEVENEGMPAAAANIETDLNVEENSEMQPIQEAEIDAYELDHAEIIEYLFSSQGKRDNEDLFAPSFSLGVDFNKQSIEDKISDICNDVLNDHGDEIKVNKEADDKDMITPAPEEHQKRARREAKVAAAYRSPYVQRDIDINKKYSTQDYAVWRWILKKGRDELERVFQYGEQYCIREHIGTLKTGQQLYYSVIDVWSTLMNEKENYKAPESPLRLFFDIGLSVGPLDEWKSPQEQYKMFCVEMDHFFERHPNKKIEDFDLIFFPILQDEHFFLVCLHKKSKVFQVIDNLKVGKTAAKLYGKNLRALRNHFCNYLDDKGLTLLAKSFKKMNLTYVTMKWQTTENTTDCGIFLMRHMETYKGSLKQWNTQLKTEKMGQKSQLDKLRTKYCNAILTSHLNEKRQFVLDETSLLYNKITRDSLLSIVIGESGNKRKRFKIPGAVLFPDNCKTTSEGKAEEESITKSDDMKVGSV